MRGISPLISFVLLVAITIISTGALYFWAGGLAVTPAVTETQTSIQVHVYNSTVLKITNIGVTNTTLLALMETSAGDCDFDPATILLPGVTYNCTLATASSGDISVWADGVTTSSVYI